MGEILSNIRLKIGMLFIFAVVIGETQIGNTVGSLSCELLFSLICTEHLMNFHFLSY